MTSLRGAADTASEYLRRTGQTGLEWSDLRFGLVMGLIPTEDDLQLTLDEEDRLTDMVLLRVGRPEDRNSP